MQSYQIFQGLKVLELAGVLAGPAVGQFFAELGADVVKVESRQGGDVTRSWKLPSEKPEEPVSAYFSAVNWGKRSICLNLRDQPDVHLLSRLIEEADVVLVSFRPGDERLRGLDPESLLHRFPKLLIGEIRGYPEPDQRVGYDALLQAESGFMYLNREPEQLPVKMPVALIDLLAAHQLKEGLLVAMLNKMKTGRGAIVSVSLLEAALASLANQATNYLVAGADPEPLGSSHPNIAPYGTLFLTKDERYVVPAIGNDRQFRDFLEVLGLEECITQPEFQRNADRVTHRERLNATLAKAIATFSSDELLAACVQKSVPLGVVKRVGEALRSSLAKDVFHQSLFGIGLRQTVFKINGSKGHHLPPPPTLDAEATAVLTGWLGMRPDEAEEWRSGRIS
jgi:crotonobetainyl-CoA:carnitine CoA-transferase CaiB-like acyl-CoA transferase